MYSKNFPILLLGDTETQNKTIRMEKKIITKNGLDFSLHFSHSENDVRVERWKMK